MSILKTERPPNFDQIAARFPRARAKGIVFAYAPYIYAPSHKSEALPPELIAHESVHIARQERMGVEKWWKSYLENDNFRYVEELLAHRAEYNHLIGQSRHIKRSALKLTANKLSSPIYGGVVTKEDAMVDLSISYLNGCSECYGFGNIKGIDCKACDGLGFVTWGKK